MLPLVMSATTECFSFTVLHKTDIATVFLLHCLLDLMHLGFTKRDVDAGAKTVQKIGRDSKQRMTEADRVHEYMGSWELMVSTCLAVTTFLGPSAAAYSSVP